jgi:hypothetical protein
LGSERFCLATGEQEGIINEFKPVLVIMPITSEFHQQVGVKEE